MKKWIVLCGLWIVVIAFHCAVCYSDTVKLTIEVDSDLYQYLEKTVNMHNDTNSSVEGYILKTPATYMSEVMAPTFQSYKEQIQKTMIEAPELRDMALKFASLSPETQAALKSVLDNAVEAEKPK